MAPSITPAHEATTVCGRDGIEGWQRAAGHRLPPAALDQGGSPDALRKFWSIVYVCGAALPTGDSALQHRWVELGPRHLQDGSAAHRARTAETHAWPQARGVPYLFRNTSTRPAGSTIVCWPV